MEVILREHVDNLGRRGEIVKVADGYARNYLLPRKLALLATEGNKKQIERERAKFDAKEAEEQKVAEAHRRPAGERRGRHRPQGRRDRGAVRLGHDAPTSPKRWRPRASRSIAASCSCAEPIKKLGDVDVPVKLHRDVTAHVKVQSRRRKERRSQLPVSMSVTSV